ncbi:long-chain fatty acid--CoA ligase [Salinibacillus xinjiangensis]|uniref:Long-chain-fatty-acid--CoA ligase n=1 Tax=Salinibacillus xinjiangensis TaxID=1229268 RepID=A0A6G1X2A2_9BACI|nr:long-chain fatty acid--CoA ligase [Salinibacillus xinjiangensis]MRG85113.1 long-chain-fatty-acid--CoA ligase [Salinibacillus xinjiangensis]
MMDTPLTLVQKIERAEKFFSKKQVVSRTSSKIHRLTYKDVGERARALSSSLEKLGVKKGDCIATLAWNHHRHLEAYFAVPCMGAVLHMANFRLSEEHLSYILNHAEDQVILVDEDIVPIVEKVQDQLKTVKAFVIMTDKDSLPSTTLSPAYSYEDLIADGDPTFEYTVDIDENDPAAMCYTSATTGKPKGVVYSHRGLVLHSMALGLSDTLGLSESDVLMPVVPMFHVNAWGLPFASTWFGTTQVLPGPMFTPKLLAELIESEQVTLTAGVPTVWLGLLNELEINDYDMSSLRAVVCGGSAAPRGIIRAFESKHGIPFLHAYGLTETTPVVTAARLKSYQQDLPEEEKLDIRSKQGLIVPGLEAKVVNDRGEVKRDGKEMGELLVRGPWIANEYYKDDRSEEAFRDGWLHTGDIATIDEEGNIKLVDRTKDLIKSGGEWISSVDLENTLMAHESVFEAAVVAVPHPKWIERPIACVVLKDQYKESVTKEVLFEHLKAQFAKWWIPDDIVFIEQIPKTSVGKFLKRTLREQLKDHLVEKA